MIERSTVLVLGAGASAPYGFPLGDQLRERIIRETGEGDNQQLREVLVNFGESTDAIDDFRNAFQLSAMPSIDSFLARREKFIKVGKAAVAATIKMCENRFIFPEPPNYNGTRPDHWYKYLWSKLDASWNEFGENKLRVITFNYDRSLETFLLQAITNSFENRCERECLEMLSNTIPVLHVYGAVGGEFGPPNLGMNNWSHFLTPDRVREAVEGIRVIPESREETPELQACREWLLAADQICFLGFGFDSTNLRRLNAAQSCNRVINPGSRLRNVFASAMGLTAREMQQASERCGNSCNGMDVTVLPVGFARSDMDCLATLRYFGVFG